jgi:PEP-CTERM motif
MIIKKALLSTFLVCLVVAPYNANALNIQYARTVDSHTFNIHGQHVGGGEKAYGNQLYLGTENVAAFVQSRYAKYSGNIFITDLVVYADGHTFQIQSKYDRDDCKPGYPCEEAQAGGLMVDGTLSPDFGPTLPGTTPSHPLSYYSDVPFRTRIEFLPESGKLDGGVAIESIRSDEHDINQDIYVALDLSAPGIYSGWPFNQLWTQAEFYESVPLVNGFHTARSGNPIIDFITSDLSTNIEGLFNFSVTASDWLTDISPGSNSYAWDLNQDGIYDDFFGLNGSHSFSNAGLHKVGVKVSNSYGFSSYGNFTVDVKPSANVPTNTVPEPSVIALFMSGLFGLGFARRRVSSCG